MCITFFYVNPSPKLGEFSLVLIMNRDEYMQRPTQPASWQDGILAGRDMEVGKGSGINYVYKLAIYYFSTKKYVMRKLREEIAKQIVNFATPPVIPSL